MIMRDIRFRGYNRKNGKWLYGFYLQNRGQHFVCPDEFATGKSWEDYEIEPETLGQYTGVKDANGVPIYEGDIIATRNNPSIKHLIFYKEEQGRFMAALNGDIENDFFGVCGLDDKTWVASKVVIGNIHDNPELLTTSK